MKIFFQLLISLIIFVKIKTSYKELTNKTTLSLYYEYDFYINLTNYESQVELVYLDIMVKLPKGYELTKTTMRLLVLESDEIKFDDVTIVTQFGEINSYSHNSKYGVLVEKEDWFYFRINLKLNTKYLLFRIPAMLDENYDKIYPTYKIKMTANTKTIEKEKNNDEKMNNGNKSYFHITFIVIILLPLIIYILIIYFIKKKSEKNIPENNTKSTTMLHDVSTGGDEGQSPD